MLLYCAKLAAEPVRITAEQCCDINAHLRLLSDPSGELSFAQIKLLQHEFQIPLEQDLSFGYRQGALWLHLDVESTQDALWWWVFRYASLDQIDFYVEQMGQVSHFRAGDMVAPEARPIVHRLPAFPIPLNAGQPTALWVRIQSEGSLTLQSDLLSNPEFIKQTANDYLTPALYFGALLALAGYNFLLYLALRERVFFYYVLFVLTFGLGIVSLNGLGAIYLWASWLNLGNRLLAFGFTAASLSAILFTRDFLNTKKLSPGWDSYLRPLVYVMSLATLVVFVMPVQASLVVMTLIGLLVVLVLTVCAVQGMLSKAPGALLFAIAWSLLLLGTLVMSLRNMGFLPSNFLTMNAMQIGSVFEMLLISLGLAARFNQHKQQQTLAQQQLLQSQQQLVVQLQHHEVLLEEKVAERTHALEQLNQQLQKIACTDTLTGLANRNAMYSQLHQALARARRRRSSLALLYLDLDGFKGVNDQFGHIAGDAVLKEVAERLRLCMRESDLICRIGGDEFLLICEGLNRGAVLVELTKRLLYQMQQPFHYQQESLLLGASIGVAISDGGEATVEQLIDAADKAMYSAKAAGKNCVQLAAEIL